MDFLLGESGGLVCRDVARPHAEKQVARERKKRTYYLSRFVLVKVTFQIGNVIWIEYYAKSTLALYGIIEH